MEAPRNPVLKCALPGLLLLPLALAQPVRLSIEPANRVPWVAASGPTNRVYVLEGSENLNAWSELARAHNRLAPFPDLDPARTAARFYRTIARPLTDVDDWKNQVQFPADSFCSADPTPWQTEARWVKFAIPLATPHRIFFQQSSRYLFHYDFAVARLNGFKGLTRAEFDAVSLHTNGQQVVLGALLFPPTTNDNEIGIQFAGLDPFPAEQVARWYQTVEAMVARPAGVPSFYLPTFEQAGVARERAAWFASQGIAISSPARWVDTDQCYATGWALGPLRYVPATDIPAAYRDGRLGPADILLVDDVPAEIPPVAGILCLAPATPNSHVAILARSFEIPFVYFADPDQRDRLRAWEGREVAVRAVETYGAAAALALPLATELTPELRTEILALKQPAPLDIRAKTHLGSLSTNVDRLVPTDIRFVGGKAANLGFLRRAIPANSPSPALAFTFDLWDGYLDQPIGGGQTLRQAIRSRLAPFSWPPNMAGLEAALAEVRELIEDRADFTPAQRTALLTILGEAGFDPARKIRFRSSTNVEDTEQFTGAGLYDSYSGCLADDLDGDTAGPCACESAEPRERGVFRALRKVYASFYNDNAFLERLRHGVDEDSVGMGVLVHHSTPDIEELANGVATFEIDRRSTRYVTSALVTQLGAVSVANPDGSARPEQVTASSYAGGSPYLSLVQGSGLVPLGDHVLDWETEYHQLFALLDQAARAYEAFYPEKKRLVLDFEYKKVRPGLLRVKQIREIPLVATGYGPAYLLDTDQRLVVRQGERSDLLTSHRLKSAWQFRVRPTRLSSEHLQRTVFASVQADLLNGTNRLRLDGPVTNLPKYAFTRTTDSTVDRWTLGSGKDQRDFALTASLPTQRTVAEGPLTVLGDHVLSLAIRYATPQPLLTYSGITNTLEDETVLELESLPGPKSLPQERMLRSGKLEVRTRFYWPPAPTGAVAGYTAPLEAWIETTITGLAPIPFTLRDAAAQTYHPHHHNFYEEFVFDPWLEPGTPPEVLESLAARNIRALVAGASPWGDPPTLYVLGLDNRLRPFAP